MKPRSKQTRTRRATKPIEKGEPVGSHNSRGDITGRPDRVIGLKTHQAGVNPKDRIGATKIDMTLLPVSAKVEWAKAQQFGANIYGEYNWRVEAVLMRTYLSAAYRHLDDVLESEEVAPDSMVEHLGHVMACCGILIDAARHGKLVDDRPIDGDPVIIDGNAWVKRLPSILEAKFAEVKVK